MVLYIYSLMQVAYSWKNKFKCEQLQARSCNWKSLHLTVLLINSSILFVLYFLFSSKCYIGSDMLEINFSRTWLKPAKDFKKFPAVFLLNLCTCLMLKSMLVLLTRFNGKIILPKIWIYLKSIIGKDYVNYVSKDNSCDCIFKINYMELLFM